MSDLSDLLGGLPKKSKKQSEGEDDALDFLSGFKKKVQSGDLSSSKSDSDEETGGITPLDIAGLPEDQKSIMFFMLRDKAAVKEGIGFEELQEHFDADEEPLVATLTQLIEDHWLIVIGEPPDERYKLNLRRRRGSLNSDIWSALE